jgi:hypothetical protein
MPTNSSLVIKQHANKSFFNNLLHHLQHILICGTVFEQSKEHVLKLLSFLLNSLPCLLLIRWTKHNPETSRAPLALPEARECRRLNPLVEPPPSSFPRRRCRQGPPGEALVAPAVAACLSPRPRERVRDHTLPGGGAPRVSLVQRGRVVMVVWRRRDGAPWSRWSSPTSSLLNLGSSGSRWAQRS